MTLPIVVIAIIGYVVAKVFINEDDTEQEQSNKFGFGILIGIILFILFIVWRIGETN
jgi:hypothetical protein